MGDGKLTEAQIKKLAAQEVFLPKDFAEARDQLRGALCFLLEFLGPNTIAVGGIRRAIEMMVRYDIEFTEAAREDRSFLVRFLHLVDVTFQNFCKELQDLALKNDPMTAAHEKVTSRGPC